MLRTLIVALALVSASQAQSSDQELRIRVSWQVEERLLEKAVPAKCSPLARSSGAAKVILQIEVNKEGVVRRAEILGGDPIHGKEAINAIRQWRFRPYILNGEPVVVETQAEVNVCNGKDVADEGLRKRGAAFVKQFRTCEKNIKQQRWAEGEIQCSQALQMARDLPSDLYIERTMALRSLGQVRLMSQNPADAKTLLDECLRILEVNETPDGYDIARTVLMQGMAESALGNTQQAQESYSRAEEIFAQRLRAINQMTSTGLFKDVRNNHRKQLSLIYTLHAELLDSTGNKEGASTLRSRAEALTK